MLQELFSNTFTNIPLEIPRVSRKSPSGSTLAKIRVSGKSILTLPHMEMYVYIHRVINRVMVLRKMLVL